MMKFLMKFMRISLGQILIALNALFAPKTIAREIDNQKKIDAESKKYKLYYFTGCPFCIKVQRQIKRLNIPIELRNIKKDPTFEAELMKGGGQYQVPCLRIEKSETEYDWMYESSEINAFLESKFNL